MSFVRYYLGTEAGGILTTGAGSEIYFLRESELDLWTVENLSATAWATEQLNPPFSAYYLGTESGNILGSEAGGRLAFFRNGITLEGWDADALRANAWKIDDNTLNIGLVYDFDAVYDSDNAYDTAGYIYPTPWVTDRNTSTTWR